MAAIVEIGLGITVISIGLKKIYNRYKYKKNWAAEAEAEVEINTQTDTVLDKELDADTGSNFVCRYCKNDIDKFNQIYWENYIPYCDKFCFQKQLIYHQN